MTYKKLLVCLAILLASGCASNPVQNADLAKESAYTVTKNYKGLINLYRQELQKKDSDSTRIKLAQAYLNYGDPGSAVFVIAPVNKKKPSVSSLIIQAKAQLELGEANAALSSAIAANKLDKTNGETENLLGVIYATKGMYPKARQELNLARSHFYSEIKVTNNLVVLDILQGKYQQAINRIMPLYRNDQADKQMTANLILAVAKSKNLQLMQSLLEPKYSDREIAQLYLTLQSTKEVSLVKQTNASQTKKAPTKSAKNKKAKG